MGICTDDGDNARESDKSSSPSLSLGLGSR
jgi:hypothetical protein